MRTSVGFRSESCRFVYRGDGYEIAEFESAVDLAAMVAVETEIDGLVSINPRDPRRVFDDLA
jgi:hypothetical protein